MINKKTIYHIEQTNSQITTFLIKLQNFIFYFTFLYSGAWAFCDRDDPDAFQLILKSQDGSLVSITPLGNIMWHREEGLASLDVVKLITRDVADGDGNQIIYF